MEQSGARALPARLRPFCVRSRIAHFVRCLLPSLPRRKACLGRSFVQTAERDLSTLANGVFARASRSLSAVFLPRSQDEKRVLVARSSRQRSAIYRRSRTVCSLAHRALCPLSSSLAPKTKSVSWSLVRPDSGARFIDARERCVRLRNRRRWLSGQGAGKG